MMNKIIKILVFFVIAPLSVSFAWFAIQDYGLLIKTVNQIQKDPNNQYLISREQAHRLNVMASGIWFLQSINILLLALILLKCDSDHQQ